MNTARFALVLTNGLLLSACGDALVYGERTSISVASIRVNDDPSTPVAVKLGFDRHVVSVAPPIGGVVEEDGKRVAKGEAVSQFSNFIVSVEAPIQLPTVDEQETEDLLTVQSRFASGGSAIELAGNPKAAAAIMGIAGEGLDVPSEKEIIQEAFADFSRDSRGVMCRIAKQDFDSLSDADRKTGGTLSRYHDLYDKSIHDQFRTLCQE